MKEKEKIAQLYPKFAEKVNGLLFDARKLSMAVGVLEGLRTFERQKELYALGRDSKGTVVNKSKVVTYSKPGESYHHYGIAVDIVFDNDGSKPGFQWTWDKKYPWGQLAVLGKDAFGLEPGYFWTGRITSDDPHFQMTLGFKASELQKLYSDGGLPRVWQEFDKR